MKSTLTRLSRHPGRGRSYLETAANSILIITLLISLPVFAGEPEGKAITGVRDEGRIIFRNDSLIPEESLPVYAGKGREKSYLQTRHNLVTSHPSDRFSAGAVPAEIVYWSNEEKRWKHVATISSRSTMRKAMSAVHDVQDELQRRQPSLVPYPSSDSLRPWFGRMNVGSMNAAHSFSDLSAPPRNSQHGGRLSPQQIDREVEEASARHQVDPDLVRALVRVESNFNPRALSRKGAMGLMQLMPRTAHFLNVGNAFDPRQNLDGGVRHLKGLLEAFQGNVELSLAAYNAGQGAVERNNGIPPYHETRNYVKKITELYGKGHPFRMAATISPIRVSRSSEGHLVFSNADE